MVHALRGSPALRAAFALESSGTAVAFLVGPALIGTVSGLGDPVAGSVTATGLVLAGGLALAAQVRTAPPPAERHQARPARLLRRAFLALVGTNIGIGVFFGSMQVSVTAFVVARNAPGLAGPLYSITSLVGLLAGIAYGARRWRTAPRTQLVVVLAVLVVTCLPLLAVRTPLALGLALALPGLAIAPFQTLSAVVAEDEVDPAVLTQAFTWLNSGSAAGIALGAAITGRIVDALEPRSGFAVALLATALALSFALLRLPALRRRSSLRG